MEFQSRNYVLIDPASKDKQGLGSKHLQYLKQHFLKIKDLQVKVSRLQKQLQCKIYLNFNIKTLEKIIAYQHAERNRCDFEEGLHSPCFHK